MEAMSINEILRGKVKVASSVKCRGWVRTRRDSKAGISFINLHDGSCFDAIQVVVPDSLPNYQAECLHLTTGCAIEITGKLVDSMGQGQQYEIQADNLKVVGWVHNPETYPLAPKRHSLEHLREVAHLRPRTNTIGAVSRIRHSVMLAIHNFLNNKGFIWVNTPIISASDTEGAGDLFKVSTLELENLPYKADGNIDFSQDFFGKPAFLTVSGQLNVESYCLALSKVYTFGPTFRAENSNTTRHLAEFWMVEPEVAFADLYDVANLAEDMLKFIFGEVLSSRSDDISFFQKYIDPDCISRLEKVINSEFEFIEYTDAVKKLIEAKENFQFPISWGKDLQTEHERYLTEKLIKKPVIVTNYPKDIKAFYMRENDDKQTVAAMDILVPGIGEIIGGSQREERLDKLKKRMQELRLPHDEYAWYLDLREYGSVPHSGFGLGFERLLNYLTGLTNIRDVIPFPRTPKNISF